MFQNWNNPFLCRRAPTPHLIQVRQVTLFAGRGFKHELCYCPVSGFNNNFLVLVASVSTQPGELECPAADAPAVQEKVGSVRSGVRLGLPPGACYFPFFFTFAHRRFCAAAIFLRLSTETLRRLRRFLGAAASDGSNVGTPILFPSLRFS